MTIDDLIRIMPPPSVPQDPIGSWSKAERLIGIALPNDFKDFVQYYGTGQIGDFISILNPFSRHNTLNLVVQAPLQVEVLRELSEEGETLPYPLFPNPNGLLPAGLTDNGDVIYWITAQHPDDWEIAINEARSPTYESYRCGLVEFLYQLTLGRIHSSILPTSVVRGALHFESVGAY